MIKRKETIIRYLGRVGRGDRCQIAEAIGAGLNLTSVRLTELKRAGVVKNVEWPDGNGANDFYKLIFGTLLSSPSIKVPLFVN